MTGSQNELVKYFNEPDNLTWSQNVMFPTGSAVLSSSENFISDEIMESNPNLIYDEDLGSWRSSSTTPKVAPNHSCKCELPLLTIMPDKVGKSSI